MKILAVFLSAALFFLGTVVAVAQSTMTDTTDCHLAGFNRIKVQGPFKVYISQGNAESVKLVAPPEITSRIVSTVDGHTLKIHNKHENWSLGPKGWYSNKSWWHTHQDKVTVYITTSDINSITVSGSGIVVFTDSIAANSLTVRLRGSAELSGSVRVKKLTGSISGSGRVKLTGTATVAEIRLSGSGHFSASEMVTESANVLISGSGHASVNASDRLNAALHGSAGLSYTGTAKINSIKSGSAVINRF